MNVLNLNYEREKKKTKDTFFVQIPNAFVRNKELNMQEKIFYIYVCGFGNSCFQNQSKICNELGITKPTLRKVMKGLEEKNYIYVQRKYSENAKEKATPVIYPLPLDKETGLLTNHYKEILDYSKTTFPSDY
ncbi:helix-turn-helix domain-containing protein [Clostridium botulinum]|uniref:helix-turn-helix domain-containing protein n=1 Tax=Clostridium botulinum TaxID=1491 RepID=UPI00224786B3|nr:helix-turn-helix domain-containing protein [Clostridium botulinum]UZP04408.1 helix-turn-helix domain-containing protein [Clostridium botulinum]UZP07820.1 helix-turn-helix domain-containing protein [Clostridium botulinum]UZP11147.1 helix-turn-helix domain-containing protein [Clostridium botulinum]